MKDPATRRAAGTVCISTWNYCSSSTLLIRWHNQSWSQTVSCVSMKELAAIITTTVVRSTRDTSLNLMTSHESSLYLMTCHELNGIEQFQILIHAQVCVWFVEWVIAGSNLRMPMVVIRSIQYYYDRSRGFIGCRHQAYCQSAICWWINAGYLRCSLMFDTVL